MILLGTSGYHFPDWTGVYYPPQLAKDEWLAYYARDFRVVEINTTYYGLPKRSTVEGWVKQTPLHFGFVIKVHSETTHKRSRNGEELGELLDVLAPVRESKQLRGLLAQFPASFHFSPENREYLAKMTERVDGISLFVEFRHISWDNDKAVDFCREQRLGWVAVDQPKLPGLARTRAAVTTDTAYVRLHGRNAHTWYTPTAGDRYDWDYSDEELAVWLPRLRAIQTRAELTYLFFNNCHAGQAIKNAKRMRELLADQFEVL